MADNWCFCDEFCKLPQKHSGKFGESLYKSSKQGALNVVSKLIKAGFSPMMIGIVVFSMLVIGVVEWSHVAVRVAAAERLPRVVALPSRMAQRAARSTPVPQRRWFRLTQLVWDKASPITNLNPILKPSKPLRSKCRKTSPKRDEAIEGAQKPAPPLNKARHF